MKQGKLHKSIYRFSSQPQMLDAVSFSHNDIPEATFPRFDGCSNRTNIYRIPTLTYSNFQFILGVRLSPVGKHSFTQLIPYGVIHRIEVWRVWWPVIFLDVDNIILFKELLGSSAGVGCCAVLLKNEFFVWVHIVHVRDQTISQKVNVPVCIDLNRCSVQKWMRVLPFHDTPAETIFFLKICSAHGIV